MENKNTYAVKFWVKGETYEKLVGLQSSKDEAMKTFNNWFPDITPIDARLCNEYDKGRFFNGLRKL